MEEVYQKAVRRICQKLGQYTDANGLDRIRRAAQFAHEAHGNQLRKSGKPYFEHPLEVANILVELRMDFTTVAGGLLHDVVEDTGVTLEEVENEFGEEIATLVDGVTKISELKFASREAQQAENFRKMILSMVKDVRVILIKFADRLHNMRTIEYLPQKKRTRIALETRDVYAPLAHRLGIAKIKWELEDATLKVLDPDAYWDLVRKIADKRDDRERYIRRITTPIQRELRRADIKAKIGGRPKHFYSVYGKMKRRGRPFEEIYDLLAIRIIVDKVEECYHALGIVHSLYTPVSDRFKDYIATPKSNMYQSLHTTVVGHDGKMAEIQIRTTDMNRTAEEGIAAHWKYKEGRIGEDELDVHFAWLRQILDWQQEARDPQDFMENLKIDLFHDEVFIFTPNGDLLRLPAGSTPVDFAFAVHTAVGLHCLGAKVNGRIVSLDTKLRSGDTVEILTSPNQKPNPAWIKFAKTTRARNRIKKWIRESQLEQSVKLGEEILQKNLKKLRIKYDEGALSKLLPQFGFHSMDQLLASLGRGDTSILKVAHLLSPEPEEDKAKPRSVVKRIVDRTRRNTGVKVQGLDSLMIHFAGCCNPVPGDRILGFVSKGRGIVVHRTDCKNIAALLNDPDRNIEVQWDVDRDRQFIARIYLLGEDRKNFLRDISECIATTDTNIVSVEMKAQDGLVHSTLILEVKNLQQLSRVINRIGKVPAVLKVDRLSDEVPEVSPAEEAY